MKEGTRPLDIEGAVGRMHCSNPAPMSLASVAMFSPPAPPPAVLVRGAVKSYKQRVLGLGGNVSHVLRGLNMTVPSGSM